MTNPPDDEEDTLITTAEIAAWSLVLSLLIFLAVVFASLAAFHLIASIY